MLNLHHNQTLDQIQIRHYIMSITTNNNLNKYFNMLNFKVTALVLLLTLSFNQMHSQTLKEKLKKKLSYITGVGDNSSNERQETRLNVPELKKKMEQRTLNWGTAPDQGVTSEMHKKYMGQIVFSNSQIQFKKENESTFKKEINIEDPLFCQYYLERSIVNEEMPMIMSSIRPSFYSCLISINGKPTAEWQRGSWRSPGKDRDEWTTNGFPLATDDIEKQNIVCNTYSKAVANLEPGTYDLKIEMSLVNLCGLKETDKPEYSLLATQPSHVTILRDIVTSGSVKLKVTAKGKAIFLQKFAIRPPKSAQQNPALEKEIKQIAANAYKETVLKAVILTPKWEFVQNDLGIVTHKVIYGLIITKDESGNCQGNVYQFAKDRGDGSKYGSTYLKAVAGYSEWTKEYTCSAIK